MSLSVALCTFNGAAYLDEQLQSLAAQERLPDELVVCDDGSTDDSAAIVRRFSARAPFPVRLEINATNLGSRANFARAITLCRGEWIALCDQDDVWRPAKLDLLCEVAKREPAAGLVFSDAELIDERGQPLGERLWRAIRFSAREQRAMRDGRETSVLLRHNVVSGATLIFRAAFRDLLLPIPSGWVHDGWIALLLAAVTRLVAVAEPLIAYRQHAGQQIGERERSLYQQYLSAKRKTIDDYRLVGGNFQAAGERLAQFTSRLRDPTVLTGLAAKVAHFRYKTAMREVRWKRFPLVAQELFCGRYARYSTGWRSLMQDLFF